MMMDYKCKFCGKPGKVDVGEHTSGIFDLTKWVKILCCDPCGQFMESKRKVEDAIKAECLKMWAFRKQERDREKVSKEEVKAEEILTALTKRYATLVCDHYKRQFVWDAEFVNTLMDNPTQSASVLSTYRHGIAKAP